MSQPPAPLPSPEALRRRVLGEVLPEVETPGQYIGGETNSAVKPSSVGCRLALVFPDAYPVGMSHLGLKLLYEMVNARPDAAAERAFAPLPDMERELRARGLPLWGLESFTPLAAFDAIGFSLQYELTYTNVLNVLDLAGLPVRSAERGAGHPLIIAGGPGAYNPEPLADFIDVFLIGEAEDSLSELVELLARAKASGAGRRETLLECARRIRGAYVPALYRVSCLPDGRVASVEPAEPDVPALVERRVVQDLETGFHPVRQLVPLVETVHDRLCVEIMRGCAHGCRFCQAGATYRPRRWRSVKRLMEIIDQGLAATGYDEVGLLSLSSSDYPHLLELVNTINARHAKSGVSVSLPSLRISDKLAELPALVSSVRKSAMTVAPEAATERLRAVINKPVSDDELFRGLAAAFRAGWNSVKLYFMIGLPTETDEDVAAIARLAARVADLGRREAPRFGRVTASVSNFVPKPGTPFQWEPMLPAAELLRRRDIVFTSLRSRRVELKFHDAAPSCLEGAIARGDRRMGRVIELAWRKGCRLDGWSEHFRADLWAEAFREAGVDPAFYAERARDPGERLPWDHISAGAGRDFLLAERAKSLEARTSVDCPSKPGSPDCAGCGACPPVE
ncbi:MAG TPA: TIGR03960 family B12-binding radical SAM protein [Planctomycetota bacterium]|nr:TIGR03960 family B12-binding radical SAM protein [Planctomycetota bacterium]